MTTEPKTKVVNPDTYVELIGGPLCGKRAVWPLGHLKANFKYYGGFCTYEYEGRGKAVHARHNENT